MSEEQKLKREKQCLNTQNEGEILEDISEKNECY